MANFPVPTSIVVPALVAAAAYINARCQVYYDLHMLNSIMPTVTRSAWWKLLFLRFEDKVYTYAQAYDNVLRYSVWLKEHHGIKKEELVALDFQNTDTLVFLLFAVWSLGAIPALINYNLSGSPLAHCVQRPGARLVLVDPVVAANFEVVTPALESQMLRSESIRPPDDQREDAMPDDMGALVFTSGTTGLPKAAIVSWAKTVIVGGFAARFIGTRSTDVYYTPMLMGLSNALSAGATFAISRKKHGANIIQYVGEICRYLLSAPPAIDPVTGENLGQKHLVRLTFGNGLRPDVWNRFKERFGIETVAEFYGATEGSFGTWNLSRNDLSMGAIGRNGSLYNLILGWSVAIVRVDHETELPYRDPNTGFCCKVQPDEPGELMFRLPPKNIKSRFQGYYGDEAATSKKIMTSVFSKGDFWFRTGDVVRHDAKNQLYFTDRISDTFRWKSENVSTAEAAQVLGLHPAISESNVYGVELPQHEGWAGCAAVVLQPSSDLGEDGAPREEILRELAGHVRAELPKYALPLFLRVVKGATLQVTGTNKKQKHHLRNEGVDPSRTGEDAVFWLKNGTYVKFSAEDWKTLEAG
ncbi:hypothetical protein B0T18DRAFT_479882 [Schizothecium vesticola]|uniref:Acetyl-CoA synthetase-like protein n=1 Tax=Schizothecium vesticola TaxID=314040 RepID=A0AA40F381_9PEZI|nr:hypothetical protein B0T18DRAFT_479882 [Schizothecium vesticola]